MTLLLSAWMALPPAEAASTEPQRTYELTWATHYDLDTAAAAGPMLHRVSVDAWAYGIRPHLPPVVDGVLTPLWSFAFTYSTMLWPHEFGHWSRAHQVDSQFIFHDFNPILPNTTVEMPEAATDADRALLSVGGFEVNAMVARKATTSFYAEGGAWSDELAHGLVNEMFFPCYAAIFPAKATEPNTWIETRGDPVHFVLPVFQRATGRDPVMASGEVDPELVRLYRESVALSVLWGALDPGTVQVGRAFFDPPFARREAWMPVDTENFAWTWSTQFYPSPLGYVLELNHHVRVGERALVLSTHMARPMKNRGLRLEVPKAVGNDNWGLGLAVDAWDQDDHGPGVSVEPTASVRVSDHFTLLAAGGYKTEGYVLGRNIDAGPHARVGLAYHFDHREPAR